MVETIFEKNISFARAGERIKGEASKQGLNGRQYFSRTDKPTI